MIRHFIGTEKAIKSKRNIELALKVITFPVWFPLYLIMMICYFVHTFMEDVVFYIFDDISDTISSFIAKKFFNK